MTLQLRVINNFNNPSLPITDLGSPLFRTGVLGVYELLSSWDKSGNNKHLVVNGHTFDTQGLATTQTAGFYADTGILEPDAFTVVVAHNISLDAANTVSVVNALKENTSPFTGHRMAMTTAGLQSLSIGVTPGSYFITGGNMYGGWTAYAYTISGGNLTIQRGSGTKFTGTLPGGQTKNTPTQTICIGGSKYPAAAGVSMPPAGHIGCIAVYPGDLGDSGRASIIDSAKEVMKRRGIIVP